MGGPGCHRAKALNGAAGLPLWPYVVCAAPTGLGGGHFAAAMTHVNAFYPQRLNSTGLTGRAGDLGVAMVQLAALEAEFGGQRADESFRRGLAGGMRGDSADWLARRATLLTAMMFPPPQAILPVAPAHTGTRKNMCYGQETY